MSFVKIKQILNFNTYYASWSFDSRHFVRENFFDGLMEIYGTFMDNVGACWCLCLNTVGVG